MSPVFLNEVDWPLTNEYSEQSPFLALIFIYSDFKTVQFSTVGELSIRFFSGRNA
jgi:hypothetical protein